MKKPKGCMACGGTLFVLVPFSEFMLHGRYFKPCLRCNPPADQQPFFPTSLYPGGAAHVHEDHSGDAA